MNERYFVVCKNVHEFEFFIKRKAEEMYYSGRTSISLSNFIYVSAPEVVRGYRNPKGWLYGNWRQRTDIEHIVMTLLTCCDGNNNTLLNILREIRAKS